jgi:hypothetical protein
MTRRDFFIVDYSDDSMDLSDEDEEWIFATRRRPQIPVMVV